MMCTYCRANNEEDAHRCHRCGRRLGTSGPLVTPASYSASRSALAQNLASAPAPEPRPAPALHVVPPPAESRTSQPSSGPGIQASLFGPHEVVRQAGPSRPARPPVPAKPRGERVEHPRLDFGPDVRTLKTSVAASIYSDAPVALASYRAMAAIIDTAIGLCGLGAFLLVFRVAGYQFEWNKQTFAMVAAAAVLITILYRLLFCLGNGDSIGLLMTDLRLVDFYGRVPKRRDRLYRLAGGCLSCISIGMGLLWAICDEEHLTWHDHMSKTYPTMARRPPQPVTE
jgi:hypothetical protein